MSLIKQPAPTAAPNPPASIEAALEGSLVELRALERVLYDNGQREAAVFLSQTKIIMTKVEHGIVVGRSHYLNLLQAAQRIPKDGQGGKR